jgi:hypothetical protein
VAAGDGEAESLGVELDRSGEVVDAITGVEEAENGGHGGADAE